MPLEDFDFGAGPDAPDGEHAWDGFQRAQRNFRFLGEWLGQMERASPVSVLNHGADPGGVQDSTGAIQAAIDSLGVAGGRVILPPGLYRTSAPLVLNRHCVTLCGQTVGQNFAIGTVIRGQGTHGLVYADGRSFLTLENLSFEQPPTGQTENTQIDIRNGQFVTIRSCLVRNIWNGIRFEGINQGTIEDVEVRNALAGESPSFGIGLTSDAASTLGVRFINLRLFGITAAPGSTAILGRGADTIYGTQIAATKWGRPLKLERNAAGHTPYFWRLSQMEAENCLAGIWLEAASRFTSVDVQVALSGTYGWRLGPVDAGQISLAACAAVNCGEHGYLIDGAGANRSVDLSGCLASGNGQSAVGAFDGLHIDNAGNVRVVGGQYGGSGANSAVTTATQRNGVRVRGANARDVVVAGANLLGNVEGGIGLDGAIFPNAIGCLGTPDAFVQTRTPASVNKVDLVAAIAGLGVAVRASGADADVNLLLQAKGAGRIVANAPVVPPGYTVAQLQDGTTMPASAHLGGMVRVTNGSSNRRLAISDGTSWRWPDGTVVS